MQIEVKVINGDKIRKDLMRFPEKAKKVYGDAVQRSAEKLRDMTKQLSPVSKAKTGFGAKGIPVDTGRLRQSIYKRQIQQLAAGVYPKVKYGGYVHEGTSKMPARPYLQWALELGAQKAIDAIFERYATMLP